uniref:Protein quiver n=1 Tax=Macrostomum lignano TaxID=282301 RepID=A0A1I8JSG2_9PLAT
MVHVAWPALEPQVHRLQPSDTLKPTREASPLQMLCAFRSEHVTSGLFRPRPPPRRPNLRPRGGGGEWERGRAKAEGNSGFESERQKVEQKTDSFERMPAAVEALLLAACLLAILNSVCEAQVFSSDSGGGISCYVCSSINGSNPACHDPFDSSLIGLTTRATRVAERRTACSPPGFCFKLKGRRRSDGQSVLSHCGNFKLANDGEQQYFDGCVTMCRFDGCNSASRGTAASTAVMMMLLAALLLPLKP